MNNRINIIIYSLVFSAILFCTTGCVDNNLDSDTQGAIRLQVEWGNESKAAPSQSELLADCVISIYNKQGMVRKYTGASSLPDELWLSIGDYRVDVEAGEATAASFNKKFWKGSKSFSITAGTTTTVPVTCTVKNSVVAIVFDASIAENFESTYEAQVAIDKKDANTALTFNSGTSQSFGYFLLPVNKSTLEWTFSGTVQGTPFTKSGQITDVESAKKYTLKFRYTPTQEETTGGLSFDVVMDKTTTDFDDNFYIDIESSTSAVALNSSDVWAKRSTLKAFVEENLWGSTGISFQYRIKRAASWISTTAVRESENNYKSAIANLTPDTEYEYQVVINGEPKGDVLTFKTEAAPTLPNGGFNDWSKSTGLLYKYDRPYASGSSKWWDSGNEASALARKSVLVQDGTTKIEGTHSAKLTTVWIDMIVTKLAAGNLFTGSFAGTVGTSGGKVNFGRPFTARPSKLKFSYKYNTSKLNHIDTYPEGGQVTSDDDDTGHIYIALGTWTAAEYKGTTDSPIQVNTTDKSTFFNPNSKDVIAYGEYSKKGSTDIGVNNGWVNAEITLDYKNTTRLPTHIMIVCTSSKLGDYFTGCDSSVLWIDNMELIYE